MRAFKYFFAQLLLNFQSKYYKDILRSRIINNKLKEILKMLFIITLLSAINKIINIKKRNFEKKLAKLNELRKVAFNKRIKISKELAKKLHLQRQSFIINILLLSFVNSIKIIKSYTSQNLDKRAYIK